MRRGGEGGETSNCQLGRKEKVIGREKRIEGMGVCVRMEIFKVIVFPSCS